MAPPRVLAALALAVAVVLDTVATTVAVVRSQGGVGEDLFSGIDVLDYSFLFDVESVPMEVNMNICVGLAGFGGRGSHEMIMTPEEVSAMLEQMLPSRTPAAVQGWNPMKRAFKSRPLSAKYMFTYEVIAVDSNFLDEYEGTVATSASVAPASKNGAATVVVDVEAAELDKVLGSIDRSLNCDGPAVLVLNPNKERLVQHMVGVGVLPTGTQASAVRYRLSYAGGGWTQAWVGRGRWLALDVTAGPVALGPQRSGPGAVLPNTIPRVQESFASERNTYAFKAFVARLASCISLGVQTVLAPDVAVHPALVTPFTRRLVVPIVAFRDHDSFSPFRVGDGQVDVAAVERELDRVLPDQEVVIVTGSHHIADHPHIARAIHRARQTDTVYVPRRSSGTLLATHQDSFDPDALAVELQESGDALAGGLVARRHARTAADFLSMLSHNWDAAEADLGHIGSRLANNTEHSAGGKAVLEAIKRVEGTHVVPVYVLSLMNPPRHRDHTRDTDLEEVHAEEAADASSSSSSRLFHHSAVASVQDELVAVLQLPNRQVELPWQADGEPMKVDGMQPTAQVLSGLLQVAAGFVPPTRHWSDAHGRVVHHYLWANGAHPFAPFGTSVTLSDVLVDTAKRNEVLVRLDAALQHARDAVMEVEAFFDKHLRDPFVQFVDSPKHQRVWIDRLFHQSTLLSPFSDATILRLHNDLHDLAADFEGVAILVSTDVGAALHQSVGLAVRAAAYHGYVQEELEKAEGAMTCCATNHQLLRMDRPRLIGAIWMLSVVVFAWYLTLTAVRRNRQRRVVDW